MTRVLIIDDRPINRQFLTTLLNYKGFETREAGEGGEGLELARAWNPDLAIVDIEMPGMDGIEFVRHVHADPELAALPIIFYTASYEASEAARLAHESRVGYVLMKPSEPAVILSTVELALGRGVSRARAAIAEDAAGDYVRLHGDAMRTGALVEFQLEISAQRRPEDVLSILARAARNIIPSEHSVVTVVDGDRQFGVCSSKDGRNAWLPHCPSHARALIEEGKPVRASRPAECDACLIGGVAVGSYIGVPVRTRQQSYGWLSLINREASSEYTAEDARIIETLAAQTATAYENILLYEQIRSKADMLDQSVNLLRTTIEASSDAIAVIDREGRFVTYNRRCTDIWGVADDILARWDAAHWLQSSLTLLKDPAAFEEIVSRVIAGEEVSGILEMKDGRFVECHGAPRVLKGEIIGRVWNCRDVTASIQAAEALRASEEKYRSLITRIPDVTWTADADGTTRFISPNIEALDGYTAAEITSEPIAFWLQRIHPDDVEAVRSQYAALFESGKPYDIEFRLRRKDGSWMWAHGASAGTYVRDGMTYADGVFRDITSRKKTEEDLRRIAAEREQLLESTGDGFYAINEHGVCTMANRVAAMLLGRSRDEVIGSRVHELMHHHKADGSPYPVEECAIYLAFRAGCASRVTDEVFWRKDGTSFPVEYVSSPIIENGVIRGAVVTFSDVTERRKLEQRLEQAHRVSSLGRMAATIAHEFNNVLMGIQPFAEVIRRSAGDEKLRHYATQILSSVARGKVVTQDILRMTRSQQPALQSVDVAEWLDRVTEEIRAQMNGNIVVDVEMPARRALFVRCDPNQMQQVMLNLALNARDAMSHGGTLTIAARGGEAIHFTVSDSGSGIPPETLPFIFEPLFTTKQSGTGLGLAVAQQLVVANGGTIRVTSIDKKGTTFEIELPAAETCAQGAPDDLLAPQLTGIRRVLLIEDDDAVAGGLMAMLEAEGVEVRVETTGEAALEAVTPFRPDAVLLDITLPDMSGIAVYDAIAAKWPELPVIFSTGHADESRLPHPHRRNVGFLRKPYGADALVNKLREVVQLPFTSETESTQK